MEKQAIRTNKDEWRRFKRQSEATRRTTADPMKRIAVAGLLAGVVGVMAAEVRHPVGGPGGLVVSEVSERMRARGRIRRC